MQEQGGFLTLADLKEHHSEWVDPVSINYRGYDIWELPPNGQGIAALQLLNILENKDFSGLQWGGEEHLHYFIEAKKRVFEDRQNIMRTYIYKASTCNNYSVKRTLVTATLKR